MTNTNVLVSRVHRCNKQMRHMSIIQSEAHSNTFKSMTDINPDLRIDTIG